MASAGFSNVHTETNASSSAGVAVDVATPVHRVRSKALRFLDWTARLLLFGVVVIGGWSTLSGLRRLMDTPKHPVTRSHLSFDPEPPSTWESLNSWTSPGEWKFTQVDPASVSPHHLVSWPADAESVATRYDERGRVVVELFTTLWPPDQLIEQWRGAGFVVRELVIPHSEDISADEQHLACELTRSPEVLLVWSVPPSSLGRVTIVCSRSESSNPLEKTTP